MKWVSVVSCRILMSCVWSGFMGRYFFVICCLWCFRIFLCWFGRSCCCVRMKWVSVVSGLCLMVFCVGVVVSVCR